MKTRHAIGIFKTLCGALVAVILTGGVCNADENQAKPDDTKAAAETKEIATGNSEVATILRKWYKEGSAAGNTGDFYDNRDADHSRLRTGPFPQLSTVEVTAEQKKKRRHWGLNLTKPYGHVTLGNSSTAASPPGGCSNTRYCLLSSRSTAIHYVQYIRSHLYVFPEHRDHDPGHNGRGGWGDLYHANVPYFITSQGSSGSDQVFLKAIAYTLAAFRPETKKLLVARGILMPTVQFIFRRSNKNIMTHADYLTGKAHPSVFEGKNVDALAMVKLAHEMDARSVPPMIQLAVLEEDEGVVGRDYFEGGGREKVFNTPAAIARVVRSTKYVRRMVVSAKRSFDVNKRPLKYHWVVLRGDAKRIKINPREKDGSVVELLIPFHQRMPVPGKPQMESNRVDIGAFVHNGTYYSAPGFVTFYFLDDEARAYSPDGRILEVSYGHGDTRIGRHAYTPGRHNDVGDWKALLAVVTNGKGGFPSKLLRRRFTAAELDVFGEVAKEFDAALSPPKEQKALDEAEAELKEAREAVENAQKELDEARKAHEKKPTDVAKTAMEKASAALKAAQGKVRSKKRVATQKRRAVANLPGVVLKSNRPGLGGTSAIVRLEDALNAVKNDVDFPFRDPDALDALYKASADETKKKAFLAARTELLGQLGNKRKGKLTTYERNRIEQLNIAVLQSVVYPGILDWQFRRNFVDWRIASQKTWRDVYHYDDKRRLTGWTRHRATGTEEFTPDGALVVTKDARGRALVARTVTYVAEGKKGAPRLLEQKPGDTVLHYTYDSDKDRVGHVEKREKPAPTEPADTRKP